MKLFLKGERCHTEKCAIEKRNFAPGQHGKDRKPKLVDMGCSFAKSRRRGIIISFSKASSATCMRRRW